MNSKCMYLIWPFENSFQFNHFTWKFQSLFMLLNKYDHHKCWDTDVQITGTLEYRFSSRCQPFLWWEAVFKDLNQVWESPFKSFSIYHWLDRDTSVECQQEHMTETENFGKQESGYHRYLFIIHIHLNAHFSIISFLAIRDPTLSSSKTWTQYSRI